MDRRGLHVAVLAAMNLAISGPAYAQALNERVAFPKRYEDGVHYGTVHRGNIREELYTSRQAIDAARAGKPFPDGTVIMMEDHRDGALHRYVAMEKRSGWGGLSPSGVRAGDWLFREFAPDGTPNLSDDGTRCMSCHRSQADRDFVFTADRMRSD